MRSVTELFAPPPRARMVPDFVLARATELSASARTRRVERLSEPHDSDRSRAATAEIRRRVRDMLGIDRLPLASVVTYLEQHERPGYRIHKLVFEATAGLPVPALLYLPNVAGPHPAVVHAPGHWMEDGKLAEPLQLLNQQLVAAGFAVLTFDPIGQGERRIGWHQHGQLAPLLVGMTTLGAMVAENIRAVSILAEREDVDAARIGMVGASGGGFTTLFASAIDERISAAVVSSIVNTHVGQLRDAAFGTGWDGWVDLCNQVPGIAGLGNLGDIVGLAAPRKLMIANATEDPPFPLTGAREVAGEAADIYRWMGAEDAFCFLEVPGAHGFQPAMRFATVDFAANALDPAPRQPGVNVSEPAFSPQWPVPHNRANAENPQTMAPIASAGSCLPTPIDTNAALVAIARDRAVALRNDRPALTANMLAEALGEFPDRTPLAVTVENHVILPEFEAQRMTISPEPGITLDCLLTLPRNFTDDLAPVLIVLDEGGKVEAFRSPAREVATECGWATFLPDLRGTGESAMSEFEVASGAWMVDRDMLNQRVWDVVRCVDLLSARYSSSQQIDKGRIVLWGAGAMGLVALAAAAADPRIAAVGSDDAPSLEDLLTVDSRHTPMLYRFHLLRLLDIDSLRAFIAPRHVIADGADGLRRLLETR